MSNTTMVSLITRHSPGKIWLQVAGLLLTVSMFAFLVKLGFWQLSRAEEKLHLSQQASLPPVTVSGSVVPGFYILLDNRTWQGRVGYQLLAPVEVGPDKPWQLVNFGWVPQIGDRSQLPDIESLLEDVKQKQLSGQLKAPSETFVLGEDEPPRQTAWRVQRLDLNALGNWMEHELSPQVLLLEPGQAPDLPRDWQPGGISVDKHRGYAVQWFALAITWLVLCGLFWRKERRNRVRSAHEK